MATRIYYTDPYCLEFDATVTAATPDGDRWRVRLDRTAFYPTTGGQPFDTGTLSVRGNDAGMSDAHVGTAVPAGPVAAVGVPAAVVASVSTATPRAVRVLDAIDDDHGEVDHVTDGPLAVGASVRGAIDRDRRVDHMQQHTGQHILSAAFDRLSKARTESFHLGTVSATIDLAREVTPAEIARAEDQANRVVWEDRSVTIRFVSAEEAAALPLRKEPQRGGELRVIDIEQFDLSACGGTHVARTGEVGMIAVRGWERFKGGTRVEFVCGVRALRSFRELRDVVNGSVRLLSVLPGELPSAIERAQADSKDLRRQMKDLTHRLAVHEAAAMAARAVAILPALGISPAFPPACPPASAPASAPPSAPASGPGGSPLRAVIEVVDGYDAGGLKTLATTVVTASGLAAALVSSTTPALVVIARSSDVTLDAAALLKQLITRFGGKGGGRPDLAQGGGLTASPEEITAALRTLIERA